MVDFIGNNLLPGDKVAFIYEKKLILGEVIGFTEKSVRLNIYDDPSIYTNWESIEYLVRILRGKYPKGITRVSKTVAKLL